jgi:hypothetical protein
MRARLSHPGVYLSFVLVLSLFLAGCGLATTLATPTQQPAATTPAPTEPADPPATPTEAAAAPTVTEPAPAGILPAPVYFISAADGQLWRIERDGASLTQITHEAERVTHYDVSPVDGSLVYVSDNSLILADADGGNRNPVFGGARDYPEDQRINNEIIYPRWSPDGRRISFGYGGIQILDLDDPMLAPHVLIPSDPVPNMNDGRPPSLVYFYRQAIWSPEADKLAVEFFHWPEGGGWAVLPMNSDAGLTELHSPPEGGILCCQPSWDLAGEHLYFASPYIGMGYPGLWRASARTGELEQFIAPEVGPGQETYHMLDTARQLPDGQLYFFKGSVEGFPTGSFTPLTMHRAAPDASNAVALRDDSHTLEEVLWADDASGAVIMEVQNQDVYPYFGPLVWLPADGSAAVRLPAEGASLAWGR